MVWVRAIAEEGLCAATERDGGESLHMGSSLLVIHRPRHPISRSDSNSGPTLGGWVVMARLTRFC